MARFKLERASMRRGESREKLEITTSDFVIYDSRSMGQGGQGENIIGHVDGKYAELFERLLNELPNVR
jgi:hypothetical protein